MKRYRNEWKYLCSDGQMALLDSRLREVMPLDPHTGPAGKYVIHSLYFDDWNDTCARENELGHHERFKYRIRYYGDSPKLLRLERKEKLCGRCHKAMCTITREEYDALVTGQVQELVYTAKDPLLKKFCADILTHQFAPKIIVDYERVAYVEPITNIRITLDKNISVSWDTTEFLSGNYIHVPLQPKHQHVLEVKFDDILPGHIKNLTVSATMQQTTFSKYYFGRKALEGIIR